MNNETRIIDQSEILRALVSDLSGQIASVKDVVGVLRLESQTRHGEIRENVQGISSRVDGVMVEVENLRRAVDETRGEGKLLSGTITAQAVKVAELETKLTALEKEIREVKESVAEDRTAVRKALSDAATQRASETEAIKAYMDKLQHALDAANTSRDAAMANVTQAVGVIVDELGIQNKTVLGNNAEAKPKLDAIAKSAQTSRMSQIIGVILIIADLVYRFAINHASP